MVMEELDVHVDDRGPSGHGLARIEAAERAIRPKGKRDEYEMGLNGDACI